MEGSIRTVSGKEDHTNNEKIAFVHVRKTGGSLIKTYMEDSICRLDKYEHYPSSFFQNHEHDHMFFTMVRDPYDRACSEFFYSKKILREYHKNGMYDEVKKSFSYILFMNIDDYLENFFNQNFDDSSVYSYYFDSKNINDFDFVGQTEEMTKTISLIKTAYGIEVPNIYKNRNPDRPKEYNFKYSRFDFMKKHSIDYEIYGDGVKRFNELCKKHGIG